MSTGTHGPGGDEQLARGLREAFTEAAPVILVDPEPVIRRGRRRRAAARALGAGVTVLAVALAVAVLPSLGGSRGGPVAGPPPEPAAPTSIFLTAQRVPAGSDVGVVMVNDSAEELVYGVDAQVERWDGERWRPHGAVVLCQDHWSRCRGEVVPALDAIEALGILSPPGSAGALERFTTAGLDDGWYRITRTDAGHVAAGVLQVAADAPPPPPLELADGQGIAVRPALVTPDGGEVTLGVLVPPGENGNLAAEDLEAALDGASGTARLARWTGSGWDDVATLPLGVGTDEQLGEALAQLPPGLPPSRRRDRHRHRHRNPPPTRRSSPRPRRCSPGTTTSPSGPCGRASWTRRDPRQRRSTRGRAW